MLKNRILMGALTVSIAVLFGGVLVAGDWHTGGALVCSDCHVMHYSQSHGYNDDGTGSFTPLAAGPHEYLLRDDVNSLCLACHDGSSSEPDVFEANSSIFLGDPRQAGALNRDNASPYFDATGHTLDSGDPAPGAVTWVNADGLDCTDCHNPHGYGAATDNPYRNLAGNIATGFGPSISYSSVTNDLTTDIFQTAVGDYSESNIQMNEPDALDSGVGKWCGQCHEDFHGQVGSAQIGGIAGEESLRHPTAGVDIGAIGGGHSNADVYAFGTDDTTDPNYKLKVNFVKVMSPTGVWPVNGVADPTLPGDLTPTCLTCHKAHGNQNSFGLIYMEKTGVVTEEGTATGGYLDLCYQCHVQGQ